MFGPGQRRSGDPGFCGTRPRVGRGRQLSNLLRRWPRPEITSMKTLILTVICCSLVPPGADISGWAAATTQTRALTFADRVAYQHAIEEVYWRHWDWPGADGGRKPSLDQVMSQAQTGKEGGRLPTQLASARDEIISGYATPELSGFSLRRRTSSRPAIAMKTNEQNRKSLL